jgi:uncharacterized membrane protein
MFSKAFLIDLAERAVATYIQALIGFLVAGATEVNASGLQAAALAAIPAALSVAKSLIASQVGDPASASLVGAETDPDGRVG